MTTFVNNNVQSGNVIYASDHNEQGARVAAVLNGNIDSANLADGAVTSGKILDGTVTNAKLSTTAGELGGAWQSWTPTYTNLTIGSGVVEAKYTKVGKTVNFRFLFRFGAGSAVGANPTITLPVTAANYGETSTGNFNIGFARYEDNGTVSIIGYVDLPSTTTMRPLYTTVPGSYTSIGALNATSPFAWAAGDEMMLTGTYEAA